MPWTAASTNRVVRKKARTGKEQLRRSRVPEKTSNSRGVMSRKLSRLTRTISTSGRPRKSPSRWRAVATPPKPPPRIRMRFVDAEAPIASPHNCPNEAVTSEAPPPPLNPERREGTPPRGGLVCAAPLAPRRRLVGRRLVLAIPRLLQRRQEAGRHLVPGLELDDLLQLAAGGVALVLDEVVVGQHE